MLSRVVVKYYEYRKYPMPSATQALLFLISEIGEVAEAFLTQVEGLSREEEGVFVSARTLGRVADDVVSRQRNWVRNGDREKKPNIEFEIGDVLQMVCVFALTLGLDAVQALYKKLSSKGFDVPAAIGKIMTEDLRHQN